MRLITDHITKNPYSRPGKKLKEVRGVVVHWVANPGASAKQIKMYFESLKDQGRAATRTRYASTQYVIGLDGEVIEMMPPEEMAYHVGAKTYRPNAIRWLGLYPNATTLGIECCHTDWSGIMTKKTYESLVGFCRELLCKYALDWKDVWLHYEVTGKECHLWFVRNPSEWKKFKERLREK